MPPTQPPHSAHGYNPTTFISSPNQAAQVFGAAGAPRQRHLFLVRFVPNGTAMPSLTFAVKHCDRPKVTIKSEELNQYNKKRHIYTGFKLEPIKITFYDSSDGAAQNMWAKYARYYFGDFVSTPHNISASGYDYDVTASEFRSGIGHGFGLTEYYGGAADSISSQWFFNCINIYHFYDQKYDEYTLVNPRIISYEPDELDYETSTVSQVNMQFVYENLQYTSGQAVTNDAFTEFNIIGTGFAGGNLPVSGHGNTSLNTTQFTEQTPSNPFVASLLTNVTTADPLAAPYRDVSTMTAGALTTFGNFSFGGSTTSNTTGPNGVNGAQFDVASAGVNSVLSTQYGTAGSTLTAAAMSTANWNNPGPTAAPIGTTLSPAAYTAINTQQTGTAQYGVNTDDDLEARVPVTINGKPAGYLY
jgi:hypothetical protein